MKKYSLIIPIYDKTGYKYLTQCLIQIASIRKYDKNINIHVLDFTIRDAISKKIIELSQKIYNFSYSFVSEKITNDDEYDSLMCNKFKAGHYATQLYDKIIIVDSDLFWSDMLDINHASIEGTYALIWYKNNKIMISDHIMAASTGDLFKLLMETFVKIRKDFLSYTNICSRKYDNHFCLNSEWLMEIVHNQTNSVQNLNNICQISNKYFHYAEWKKDKTETFKKQIMLTEEYKKIKEIYSSEGIHDISF